MSRVFVATEAALGRTVVVKVLREEFAADVNRERFRREVTLAAQLQHPHIVPLLTAGQEGDLLWYTMPFVEGESVRDEVRRGRVFSVKDVIRLLHDVLDALSYAHSRGVIHRDIKPGNILRHGNHSLVTDFGVAKALDAARPTSGTTSTGMAIGTPAYMAPEQLAADPAADHRMDLYATGLVAYEALTQLQPFAESSPQATMAAQLTRMPAPIEQTRPDIPPALSALIMRLLAKDPAARPATAKAAIEELDNMTTPTEVSRASWTGAAPATRSGRWMAVAAVALLAIGAFWYFGPLRDRPDTLTEQLAIADSIAKAVTASTAAPATPAVASPGRTKVDSGVRVRRDSGPPRTKTTAPGGASGSGSGSNVAAKTAAPAPAAKSGATTVTKAAAPRPAASVATAPARRFNPARRVAVMPVRLQPNMPEALVAIGRTIQDSLRRALAGAGYTLATDGELVELLAQQGGWPFQRRIALTQGIGAFASLEITPRGNELQVRAQVFDIWRAQFLSDDETADRDAPMELLAIVRPMSRMLDRVSWRTTSDPKNVLVFNFDNNTGVDSLSAVSDAFAGHMRALVTKLGLRVVGDSAARIVKDVTERRQTALLIGAGASIAGSIHRWRGDSILVRMSLRDHSEEVTSPNIEARVRRDSMHAALPFLLGRMTDLLNAVNWGPKRTPP